MLCGFLSARVTKSLTKCLMKTPQREREVYLVIFDIVVKGLQERCADISDKFFAITKRGDHGHAFKVMDDRGATEGYCRSAMATSKADFSARLVLLPSI